MGIRCPLRFIAPPIAGPTARCFFAPSGCAVVFCGRAEFAACVREFKRAELETKAARTARRTTALTRRIAIGAKVYWTGPPEDIPNDELGEVVSTDWARQLPIRVEFPAGTFWFMLRSLETDEERSACAALDSAASPLPLPPCCRCLPVAAASRARASRCRRAGGMRHAGGAQRPASKGRLSEGLEGGRPPRASAAARCAVDA